MDLTAAPLAASAGLALAPLPASFTVEIMQRTYGRLAGGAMAAWRLPLLTSPLLALEVTSCKSTQYVNKLVDLPEVQDTLSACVFYGGSKLENVQQLILQHADRF